MLATRVFHDNEDLVLEGDDVVDGGNVRVLKAGEVCGRAECSFFWEWRGVAIMDTLDSDQAGEHGIIGQINAVVVSVAELALNGVTSVCKGCGMVVFFQEGREPKCGSNSRRSCPRDAAALAAGIDLRPEAQGLGVPG